MNQEEKNRNLIKGITTVFIANTISAFFNVALNFLLPKFLTIDAYAGIKAYELYYTFVSIPTLGFIDGLYLEYGGFSLQEINTREIANRINTLRWFQVVVVFLLFPISFMLRDDIFFFFLLSVPSLNMINLFQLLYQATGEHSRYSRILNMTTILKTIISIAILLFITKKDYKVYLFAYMLIFLGIALWQEYEIRKKIIKKQSVFLSSFLLLMKEIKDGFVLRVGVLSGFMLSGMDRIFVKQLLDTRSFALYSFAATVENLLNVMITPVTTTMYSFFCDKPDTNLIKNIRNMTIVSSLFILTAFFPIKIIVSLFIKSYMDIFIVLALLFASKSLYMVIQGVYVNLYKSRKMQNKYLINQIIVIVIGLISNFLFYQIQPKMESFAIATLVTSVIWMIISALDFMDVSFDIKDIIYYSIGIVAFLFCACNFNTVFGMIGYILILLFLTWIAMFDELKMLLTYLVRKRVKK